MLRRLTAILALLIVTAAVAGISFVALATPVSAHATLESTTPESDEVVATAPREIVLRFDDPVDASLGGIQVYAPDSTQLPPRSITSPDGGLSLHLPVNLTERGTYTVAWRGASDDGHTLSGSFVFHYGVKSGVGADIGGSSQWAQRLGWLSRTLVFGGGIVCFGTLLFGLVTSLTRDRRLESLAWWSAALTLLGSLGIIWSRAAQFSGRSLPDSFEVLGELVQTNRAGTLDAIRIVLALVAVVAVLTPGRVRFVALPAMAAVLHTFSLSGHAWTSSPVGLTVGVDALHLLAVATWVGGIIALAVVSRALAEPSDVIHRFSAVAASTLVVVLATGVGSTLLHVDSWSNLFDTRYGRLLSVKIGVVVLMVLLGAQHRRVVARGVEWTGRRLASISAEGALGLVVIGITAALVFNAPAIDTAPRTAVLTQITDSGRIRLEVTPVRPGPNTLRISFESTRGTPRPVDAVEVSVGTAMIPSRRLDVTVDDASHVTASGVSLATPGVWTVNVIGVTGGATETTTFDVTLQEGSGR